MTTTQRFTMAVTVKASVEGLERVDKARRKKGWAKSEQAWVDLARTSTATLKRFWVGVAIRSETFRDICTTVGVDDWESVIDFEETGRQTTQTSSKRLSFEIEGSIAESDPAKLKEILAFLQKMGGDATIRILDVEEGSIKLILGGSEEALQRIEALFQSGELGHVEGVEVQDVHFLSGNDGYVLLVATELVNSLNTVVGENLPEKLANIVKLHARIAVACLLVPIPGAGLLAAAGNTWTMYIRINKEIELPFSQNVIRSIAAGVLTNIGANATAAFAFAGLGSALKFLPAVGAVASYAVMSTTIYAVTIAAGYIYMKALANLLSQKSESDIQESDLEIAVNEVLNDRDSVKVILNYAKRNYTKADPDLGSLAEELGQLKEAMKKSAVSSEQEDAVGEITAAAEAAEQNDMSRTMKQLKKAGEWALENAEELNLSFAEAALRAALVLR